MGVARPLIAQTCRAAVSHCERGGRGASRRESCARRESSALPPPSPSSPSPPPPPPPPATSPYDGRSTMPMLARAAPTSAATSASVAVSRCASVGGSTSGDISPLVPAPPVSSYTVTGASAASASLLAASSGASESRSELHCGARTCSDAATFISSGRAFSCKGSARRRGKGRGRGMSTYRERQGHRKGEEGSKHKQASTSKHKQAQASTSKQAPAAP